MFAQITQKTDRMNNVYIRLALTPKSKQIHVILKTWLKTRCFTHLNGNRSIVYGHYIYLYLLNHMQ